VSCQYNTHRLTASAVRKKRPILPTFHVKVMYQCVKGILKLILVIFLYLMKTCNGSINDIYETLTRFLSMKLCKSDIIR
jgi:hypothetical protein